MTCLASFCLSSGCGVRNPSNREAGKREDKPQLTSHVEYLDNMLIENSGLIYHDGKLWTINDSGGDPVLFALDIKTGKALQAIHVENGENVDWESLAQDERNVYICDVGNNYGRREKLRIYKISKDSIPSSGNASLTAEIIEYRYEGMEKEEHLLRRSRFDCEAAFALGDSLYLFTKDWETMTTTLYTCSSQPGTYELRPRRIYAVEGLITGADISPDKRFVVLCGYREYVPFICLFKDFDPADYSPGELLRFDYPAYLDLQTEGIAVESPERIFISCEMTEFPAALYRMDLRGCMK